MTNKKSNQLTIDYLNECFLLNPLTGDLIWKFRPRNHFKWASEWVLFNTQNAGNVAGNLEGNGYIRVRINGVKHKAHRICYWIYTNKIPDKELDIDHINGVKNDNRELNLRLVSAAENMKNMRLNKSNSSGVMGVDQHKKTKRWRARITINSKKVHLGYFHSKDEAIAARKLAEANNGYHQNHGSKQ